VTLKGGRETHHAACLKHGPWPDGWKWSHCWIWVFLGLGLVCQPSIYIVLVDEVVVDGGRVLLLCKHSSCASLLLSLRIQDDPEDGMMLAPAGPKLDLLHTPSERRFIPGRLHSTIGT
jgi:hypothetical protein